MYLLRQENKIKTPEYFCRCPGGHSWRLCVCGWCLCGRGHRARWGAGGQSPMGSPSVLSLHQGEPLHAGLTIQSPRPKQPGCVTSLPSPLCEAALLSQLQCRSGPELVTCYPECPCPSQSPRCWSSSPLEVLPLQPSPRTLPSHQTDGVITEHNYFCM